MGDFDVRLSYQNGQLEDQTSSSWSLEPSNPHPSEISAESWCLSEHVTEGIIWGIQPTRVSEERRRNVSEYVQKLIKRCLGCEIFPFGSVPLKTYLPDGDIDLTALGVPGLEDTLAGDVRAVLEGEEHNPAAEFEVKDVQYIHAEVDNIIGKDHLFKRTIILIKAWCYYESRILGAPHSLISTYALETLVLYIFHLFHTSLDGPLAVLYRFLDYFSKFDWDNFCISLRGPVRITSLPEILAEMPETDGGDLLLSTEFLNKCGETFSKTPRIMGNNHRAFAKKYLNVVDPLRENNNLGRSVSKGNLYRIRSAFAYGARKLGKILLLPRESMSNELNKFFKNTLERHGNGERPDVQDSYMAFPNSSHLDLSKVVNVLPDINIEKGTTGNITTSTSRSNANGNGKDLNNVNGLDFSKENGHDYSTYETDCVEGNSGSGTPLTRDVKIPVTSKPSGSTIMDSNHTHSSMSAEDSTIKSGHAPHLYFSQDNEKVIKEGLIPTEVDARMKCLDSSSSNECELASNRSQLCSSTHGMSACTISNGGPVISNEIGPSADCFFLGNESSSDSRSMEADLATEERTPDGHVLADLSGNYEGHYKNFLFAQWSYEFFVSGPMSPGNLPSHYAFRGPMYQHQHVNGFVPSPPFPRPPNFYPINSGFVPGSFGLEDMPKPRGTGTYFPNTNHRSYKDKSSFGRTRNQFPSGQVPRARTNGRAMTPLESNLIDKGDYPALCGNGRGKPGQSEVSQTTSPASRGSSQSNGSISPPELEFGSFGPVPLGIPTTQSRRNLNSNGCYSLSPGSMVSLHMAHRPGPTVNRDRPTQTYRLKDEEEFPPLSGPEKRNAFVHSNEHKTAWEAKR